MSTGLRARLERNTKIEVVKIDRKTVTICFEGKHFILRKGDNFEINFTGEVT
jgi:hypothetical protein